MTVYDLHRSSALPISTLLVSRVASLVFAAIDDLMRRRRRTAVLMRLTDGQLADLGLTRSGLLRR